MHPEMGTMKNKCPARRTKSGVSYYSGVINKKTAGNIDPRLLKISWQSAYLTINIRLTPLTVTCATLSQA